MGTIKQIDIKNRTLDILQLKKLMIMKIFIV